MVSSVNALNVNLANTNAIEQWRVDAVGSGLPLVTTPTPAMLQSTQNTVQQTIPEMPTGNVNYGSLYASSNPGNDLNWVYQSIYSPYGMASMMQVWAEALYHLRVGNAATYWCAAAQRIRRK